MGVRRIVTPVALIHIGPFNFPPGQRLGFLDHLLQGVTVIGVAGQGLGMEDELTALGPLVGRGQGDLDAELIGFVSFALSDAFGLRRVP